MSIHNQGGEPFRMAYKDGPLGEWHVSTREDAKFYFQHLTLEQKVRFVEIYNEGKIEYDYPGHFYVLPYFIKAAS